MYYENENRICKYPFKFFDDDIAEAIMMYSYHLKEENYKNELRKEIQNELKRSFMKKQFTIIAGLIKAHVKEREEASKLIRIVAGVLNKEN